jgi:hypothetical protein
VHARATLASAATPWQTGAAQDSYLAYYLTELAGATAILFARTCDGARQLALLLRNLGFDALPIHGQMSQPKRLGALNKFKAGERSILVATGAPASAPRRQRPSVLHHAGAGLERQLPDALLSSWPSFRRPAGPCHPCCMTGSGRGPRP